MTTAPPSAAAGGPPPLPPPLADALAERTDGAELAAVWHALAPAAEPAGRAAPGQRDAAWAALAAAAGVPVSARRAAAPGAAAPGAQEPRAAARRPTARPGGRAVAAPAWAARRARGGRPWLLAAAALGLVTAAATAVRPVEVRAGAGQRAAVTLPDGSRAELNAGSTLRYTRAFGRLPFAPGPRHVRLEGEAFFAVTRGARPFVVETADTRVTVLGTRFAVRARGGAAGPGTEVAVEEGRVRVAARAGALELGAGDAARVPAGAGAPAPLRAAPVARLLAWRAGGFAAVDQPLAAVLDEVGRRYAVEVVLRARAAAGDRVTLYYPRPTAAETIVADVCAARGLHYRRTSRGFDVF